MIKLLLLAVIPFMTEHRNVAPRTEASTNFYGSVTGIVDKAYVEGLGIESVDTQAVIRAANYYTDSATGAIRRVDGTAKVLPKYLWCRDFYDSYTNDAAWYYAQPQDYGHCSAMRNGDFLYRNLDWKFNDAADVIVRMFAGEGRFASIGVANCGTNLTEEIITSGKPSRYYKCLPGRTVDGINENGVCAEVNVVDGDVSSWTGRVVHCMGVVRWALDHGTNAEQTAKFLAANIYFPQGWTQNFHWMIADATDTYIVENGEAHKVTGKAIMTNFRLYSGDRNGEGKERYDILEDGGSIKDVWFTKCYERTTNPPWLSEFGYNYEKWNAALNEWNREGATKESHRNEHIGNDYWWQSVHTSIYDLKNLTLKIAVQETDDWYIFQVPATGAKIDAYTKTETDYMLASKLDRKSADGASMSWGENANLDIDASSVNVSGTIVAQDDVMTSSGAKLSKAAMFDTTTEYSGGNLLVYYYDGMVTDSGVPASEIFRSVDYEYDATLYWNNGDLYLGGSGGIVSDSTDGGVKFPYGIICGLSSDLNISFYGPGFYDLDNDKLLVLPFDRVEPYSYGNLAIESSESLSAMLEDASTSTNTHCVACIETNICNIISPKLKTEPHLALINGEWHIITETEVK